MNRKHASTRRNTVSAVRRCAVATVVLFGGIGASVAAAPPSYADLPGPAQVAVTVVGDVAGTIAEVAARTNTTVLDSIPGSPVRYLLQANDARTAGELALALGADPAVAATWANDAVRNAETVDASGRFRLWAASPPTAVTNQYATSLLGLAAAHALSRGAGVTVAIVDTGVQLLPAPHPAFGTSLVPGIDVVDGDAVPDDAATGTVDAGSGLVDPMAGHGTHVAGIVHLMAPGASIMPIRALDSTGAGTMWNVFKGMQWAADHGATVINASFGGRGSATLMKDAVATMAERGVVVVAAAGNDGRDRDNFPAATRCAVSVTATDAADAVAPFATTGTSVSVAAPGVDIASAHPLAPTGYASWSGSSMSAPFVAGTVALVRSVRPSTPGEVLALVAGTAKPVTTTFGKVSFGRVDPVAAIEHAVADSIPTAAQAHISARCVP